jgi:hypothetical protein
LISPVPVEPEPGPRVLGRKHLALLLGADELPLAVQVRGRRLVSLGAGGRHDDDQAEECRDHE